MLNTATGVMLNTATGVKLNSCYRFNAQQLPQVQCSTAAICAMLITAVGAMLNTNTGAMLHTALATLPQVQCSTLLLKSCFIAVTCITGHFRKQDMVSRQPMPTCAVWKHATDRF